MEGEALNGIIELWAHLIHSDMRFREWSPLNVGARVRTFKHSLRAAPEA